MSLQERMEAMRPYFRGIEMYNEAIMVKVVFPENWKCYPSDDGRIKVTPSEDPSNPNLTYYYADSKDTSYDDIFDLIEGTMKANQEIVLKLELLRTKVGELKELFSSMPYDKLQSLEFTFKEKKKRGRKKKEASSGDEARSDEGKDAAIETADNDTEPNTENGGN